MRKAALTLLLTLACVAGYAQEKNINLGIALGYYDRYSPGHSEILDLSSSSSYNGISYKSTPNVLPTITLEAGYIFPGNHIGAFMGTYVNYAWNNLSGGPSPMRESETIIHLVPQVRLYYYYTGDVRLYAIIGLGVRYRTFAETFEGDTIKAKYTDFSYVFSPFGMSFGGQWTVSCDFGHGRPWSSFNLTAGYRF